MELHIGKEIENKFHESGLKIGVFAERINTGERNVYSIFKRKDISAEMLKRISDVLGCNFFKLYERKLSDRTVSPSENKSVESKCMHISITLSSPIDLMKNFPSLIAKINNLASEYGFRVK